MADQEHVVVDLEIENIYPDVVITTEETTTLPAPRSGTPADVWTWADECLFPLTGTGRTAGPSSYEVIVRRCDNATLEGATFTFG